MAQDLLQGRVAILLSKKEVTYGTDPSPVVGSDAIVITEFTVDPEQSMPERVRIGPSWTSRGPAPGSRMQKFKFTMPFIGGGDPGVGDLAAPPWSPHLQAAGCKLTSTGSPVDTHTFAPSTSQAQVSLTHYLYIFQDGHANCELFEINGAVNSAKINFAAGKPATITCEGQGLFTKPTTVSAAASPAYAHPEGSMVCKNATLTIGGTAFVIPTLELDFGMEITDRESIGTGVDGYAGFYLGRSPGKWIGGSFDVEAQPSSSYDRWAAVDAGSEANLVLTIDGLGGDRVSITSSGLQLLSPSTEFKNPMAYKQPYALNDQTDAGDDCVSIVVTRTP